MKVKTKREITFTPVEMEAAKIVNNICDEICDMMDNNCKYCPLNEVCGIVDFLNKVTRDGCVLSEFEE